MRSQTAVEGEYLSDTESDEITVTVEQITITGVSRQRLLFNTKTIISPNFPFLTANVLVPDGSMVSV